MSVFKAHDRRRNRTPHRALLSDAHLNLFHNINLKKLLLDTRSVPVNDVQWSCIHISS